MKEEIEHEHEHERERAQNAQTVNPWPLPSNFVWRFRGGRTNDPTFANGLELEDPADMVTAIDVPVLQDQSNSWSLLSIGHGQQQEQQQPDDRGCRGCKQKILKQEGGRRSGGFKPHRSVVTSEGECTDLSSLLRQKSHPALKR